MTDSSATDAAPTRRRQAARIAGEGDRRPDADNSAAAAPPETGGDYFRAFFDNSPNDLFVIDVRPGGRFVFEHVNPMVTKSTGYTYDMLVGKTPEEALSRANSAKLTARYRECVETRRRIEYEVVGTAPIGEVVRRTVLIPIVDSSGEVRKILGTSTDLTALRRAEDRARNRTKELAELNERFGRERRLSELIVENTAEGIVLVDKDFRHLVWNAGMESINGLPRSQVLGRTVFEVFPHLADHPVGQAWRDAVAGRDVQLRDRRYYSPARGAEIVYDADFTPLRDSEGAIIGAIGIVRDTTERHRIEEMLRQSQKLEAVAQLTGGVAHDFNNLLTAVIGCLDLILREQSGERIAGLAQTALRAITRGTQLVQQLLAFARRQSLHSSPVDVNALLGECEILLRRAVGETIEIAIDAAADLPRCEVDPSQFEAAVMNLVMNARDALPRGGRVVLRTRAVAAREVPPDLDLQPGDYISVAVCDTGGGMSPEVAARAFEPFYTTKGTGKGSGLGLSMVYGFAKQSGGGVQLQSAPGAGTCITMYLRRSLRPADAALAPAAATEPQQGRGSILLVEDDKEVREVSSEMLEELGYRVVLAENGEAALRVLRSGDPIDLLFSDIVMPGLTGFDLARKARRIRPGLKVVLTTGYAGRDNPDTDEFTLLPKPFRHADLARIVLDLLQGGPDPAAAP